MAEATLQPPRGRFTSEPTYIHTPSYGLNEEEKKKAEEANVPLSVAKEYNWASGVIKKATEGRFDDEDYPSRISIARAMNELTRTEILRNEELAYELDGLSKEDEIFKFFSRVKGDKFKDQQFLRPEQDYSVTNLRGYVQGRTRVIPLQEFETEAFISPFTKKDFDPSTLSDGELLMLSTVKVDVSDVEFVPLQITWDANNNPIKNEGKAQDTRPTKEQAEYYDVKQTNINPEPLLKMLAPENYEKALLEAEKRAGASRKDYIANSVASGVLPFRALGMATPSEKQELFMPMLDPNFKTRETVAAIGGLVAGGWWTASKAAGLVDKGWKGRNALMAGAVGEGVLGVGYQHAAPGLLASYMNKPDDALLNFAEAATIAGTVGLAFSAISKLRGHKAGKFKDEIEAMSKATSKEESEAIRQRIIKGLADEPDTVPASVRNGEVLNVVTGANPSKSPSWFKRWLTADKGLDPALAQRVRQRDSAIAARVNITMKADVSALQRAVAKSGGWSDEMVAGINEGLRSGAGIGHLPENVAEAVVKLRDSKIALSKELGDHVPESLKAVFDQNMDLYLHRSYRIHDDPKYAKSLMVKGEKGKADKSNKLVRDAMDWFEADLRSQAELRIIERNTNNGTAIPVGDAMAAMVDKELKGAASDDRLLGLVDEFLSRHTKGGFKGAMEASDDVLKSRKLDPIKDKAIMKLMGIHTDPLVNYTKTISKMSTLLEQIKFSDDIHAAGTGKWVFDNPSSGHGELIPDQARFGNMAGKYTSPHIKQMVTEVNNITAAGLDRFALRWMSGIHAAVNWTKVVPSHVAQLRNVQGGLMMNMAAGRISPKGGVQAAHDFWNSIAGLKNADSTARLKKYQELGLLDENIDIAYINEFLKEQQGSVVLKRIFSQDPTEVAEQVKGIALFDKAKRTGEALGKASVGKMNEVYQGVDNMMRIYGYEQELASLRKAFRHMDPEAKMPSEFWPDKISGNMYEYAARVTTNTYPTYSRIPDAVVAFRRLGVMGNFMSFQSEMIRTSKNIVKQGWQEINSGNPALKAHGTKRLAAFTAVGLAAPKVAERTGNALSNTSSDRLDAARVFLPPWAKNSRLVMLDGNPDKFTYIDVGYTAPHTFFHEPLLHYAATGDMPDSKWHDALAKTFSPFTDERILWGQTRQVIRGKDDYGRPFKWYHGLAKAFEPGEYKTIKRLMESRHEGVRDREEWAEKMNFFTALRPSTVRMTGNKGQISYKAKDYNNAKREASAQFRRDAFPRVPASGEEQLAAFREMNKSGFKAQQILYSKIKAAEVWGIEPKKIENSMVEYGGISKSLYSRLRRGKFTALSFSKNLINKERMKDGKGFSRPTAHREMRQLESSLNRQSLSLEPDSVFPSE